MKKEQEKEEAVAQAMVAVLTLMKYGIFVHTMENKDFGGVEVNLYEPLKGKGLRECVAAKELYYFEPEVIAGVARNAARKFRKFGTPELMRCSCSTGEDNPLLLHGDGCCWAGYRVRRG